MAKKAHHNYLVVKTTTAEQKNLKINRCRTSYLFIVPALSFKAIQEDSDLS